MAQGMAYRCSCFVQQKAGRLHLWCSYPSPRSQEVGTFCTIYTSSLLMPLQRSGCSRDKLSLCAQEITLQASRTSAYQGDHPAMSPQGHLPSHLHCRNRYPHAHLHVQVLPSHIERPQARRRQVHVRAPRHDHRPNGSAVQSSFDSLSCAFWPQGNGREGRVSGSRVIPEVHGALRHGPVVRGG
jgi:hypothetical protein